MNFHDLNLPKYIEIFAVGSSEFSTSLAASMSGREARISDRQLAKRRYVLKDCRLSVVQFEAFNSFFQARAGRRYSFRLRDHFDYKVEKQIIATGDGISTEFQLQKTYEDLISPYVRKITKPVLATIELSSEGEIIQAETINPGTGQVTLQHPLIEGARLCASFEFDVPVRFVNDSFQYSFSSDGSIRLEDIELIEVVE